jgi:hypothetical protein
LNAFAATPMRQNIAVLFGSHRLSIINRYR